VPSLSEGPTGMVAQIGLDEGGSDLLNIHGLGAYGEKIGSVQVTSLDQYTRVKNIEHINFLKVICFLGIRCTRLNCSLFSLSFV